jgi:hypothetical protein
MFNGDTDSWLVASRGKKSVASEEEGNWPLIKWEEGVTAKPI